MKRKPVKSILSLILVISLLTSASTVLALGAGETKYENTHKIGNNFAYVNEISFNAAGRQESHSAVLTPGGEVYPIVMACDTIYGGMTISNMVKYAKNQGYNVLGAINTDFYSTKTHVPIGTVIENGIYKSSPEGSNTVVIDKNSKVSLIENTQVNIEMKNHGGAPDGDNNGEVINLTHFNKYRTDNGMYLFSEHFSTVSTRTSTEGWMVRFKITKGEMTASGTVELEVTELITGSEAVKIGEDNLILSASSAAWCDEEFEKFDVGDKVTLKTTCNNDKIKTAKWATGGGDILIQNGEITDSSKWDSAIASRNPRTALGVKADGTVISYVIDGRNSGYSNGMSLKVLAEEMLDMGCVSAINFDGGGSSALSIKLTGESACKTVSRPSDGAERKCASYILFVTDKKADGTPKHLTLAQDGQMVLAGSTVSLNAKASDTGFAAVTAPNDVKYTSSGLGKISGNSYTAGMTAGADTVNLSSAGTGAAGKSTIHVLTSADTLNVINKATGKAVTSLNLDPGDSVEFMPVLKYLTRSVAADSSAFTYTVSGDIGRVSQAGVYKASDNPGASGTVTVTGAGISKTINVKLAAELQDIEGHWAENYIRALFKDGIVQGASYTQFLPDNNISRGDFILMLYRAADKPSVSGTLAFSDVKSTDYYADAILWAAQKGIAQGTGDGKFNPTSPLTREQAFTFIYRALSVFGIKYSDGTAADLAVFPDNGTVSDFAKVPTATLINLGYVGGSDGNIVPHGKLTRAQMSKILYMMLEDR